MPSRAQLEEFKSSFKDVGNEAAIMGKNHALSEDFELPEDEPPSPFPEGLEDGLVPEPDPTLRVSDLGLDLPPESFTGGDDSDSGFDFGDLLGGSLDSLDSVPPAEFDLSGFGGTEADISGGAAPFDDSFGLTETESPGDTDSAAPELSALAMPDDLLSGFSEDLESGGLPIDKEIAAASEAPDVEGLAPAPEDDNFSGMEFPDIDLSEAMDMGGESITTSVDPADGEHPGNFNFPGMEADSGGEERNEPGEGNAYQNEEVDLLNEAITVPEEDSGGFDLSELPDFGDAGGDLSGGDDFGDGFPGITSGLGSLPETDFADTAVDTAADSGMDAAGFDMSGMEPGDTEPAAGEVSETSGVPPDLSSVDFAADGSIDFSMDDLSADFGDGGEDLGGESRDTDSGAEADTFPELPDMSVTEDAGTEGVDAFDQFTSGGDWSIPDTTLDTPDFTEAAAEEDIGDFSLSGFDDLDEKGKPEQTSAAGFSDDVEEIQLGEDDFRQLQDTLSMYPLNLRVACEELIVEQAVAPDKMSALIKLLVHGAPAKETAALAGKILGRTIPIPKGYAKQTGAELEAEQASLGYIFVKRFLPVLRFAGVIVLVVASLAYLIWRFAVVPLQAESLYKEGQALILSGEYPQANEHFRQAFEKHRVKKWFYRYAETFRDERQYIYAEQKYDELLRVYPRDKKGALDYAAMETNFIRNYEKADRIIRTNILDYAVNDREGLLALAETNLAWGETDASRYEEARGAYSRLMEQYGRKDPYLEGMLKYFIRTDKLGEVIPLQNYFMGEPKKRNISVPTLAELGGYLLDKQFEETEGVPEEYVDSIEGVRDVLIRAIQEDGTYPESFYHLARYNFRYGLGAEARRNLEDAIRAFSAAREETPKRTAYHIDARRRYGEVLINAREFFPAEEELIRGVRLYEDARARGVIKNSRPEFGRLYANLGDLEFFAKSGDMEAALRFYEEAERNDWAPPEIQYRMGTAHYQNGDFEEALRRFFTLSSVMPNNRRLLYALGNAAYLRGNYFAAQGYYNRLMDLLDAERVRFPNLIPGGGPDEQDLAERVMVVDNNLGVTLEALTRVSGDTAYRTRALYLFSESIRAWDMLTRDPDNLTRMQPIKDLYSPGINLAYLNAQNILRASPSYEQQIFMRIDKDCLEPSDWEALVPSDYRLSDQLPMNVE